MPYQSARKGLRRAGFSLIELLIVIAIMSALFFPLILTYRSYRTSQALVASTEAVANNTKSVHIFAREAHKQREWGIKNNSKTIYVLYSSGPSGATDEQSYVLDSGVEFEEDFDVMFEIGTGKAESQAVIKLINTNGRKMWVEIEESGVVEVNVDP